jgi:hypothetical protein
MRLYSLYLTDALREGLKTLKARDGISEAEAIRRAVGEFLKHRGVAVKETKGGRGKKRK